MLSARLALYTLKSCGRPPQAHLLNERGLVVAKTKELSVEELERFHAEKRAGIAHASVGLESAWNALRAAQESDKTKPSTTVPALSKCVDRVVAAGQALREAREMEPGTETLKAAS